MLLALLFSIKLSTSIFLVSVAVVSTIGNTSPLSAVVNAVNSDIFTSAIFFYLSC